MSDVRKYEIAINKCAGCPNCKFAGGPHICKLTEKIINLDYIDDDCPLPKLNNLESAIKDILEEE